MYIKNPLLVAGSVLIIIVSLATKTLASRSIGVNFSGGVNNVASTDSPGIVPATNWNNVTGGSDSHISLIDNTGATTTAILSFQSAGAYNNFNTPNTKNISTNTLYRSGLFGDNTVSEVSITISNIPYSSYNLYTYASNDSLSTSTLSITVGQLT